MATIIESDSLTIVAFKRKRSTDETGCLTIASNVARSGEVVHVASSSSSNGAFSNAAFSSTPKKQPVKGSTPLTTENQSGYLDMEIKSIADLVSSVSATKKSLVAMQNLEKNPFEVIRKPPKKKTKKDDRLISKEEACFENAALNLALPEKQFNPYEVIRDTNNAANTLLSPHCFTNAALNLKHQDTSRIRNPFEISREDTEKKKTLLHTRMVSSPQQKSLKVNCNGTNGRESADSEKVTKQQLQIKLPFKPTVGCRINFQNITLSELSPSKLRVDKLLFSPTGLNVKQTKALSTIAEEESATDIGKELDCFQLELENSINEAKLNNRKGIKNEQVEEEEEEMKEPLNVTGEVNDIPSKKNEERENPKEIVVGKNPFLSDNDESGVNMEKHGDEEENQINLREDSSSSFVDMDPTPFVRNYRKPETIVIKTSVDEMNENNNNNNDIKSTKDVKEKTVANVGKMLRRSIRRFMNLQQQQQQKTPSLEKISDEDGSTKSFIQNETKDQLKQINDKQNEESKENGQGFMNSLRRSLRRTKKPSNAGVGSKEDGNQMQEEEKEKEEVEKKGKAVLDVSIIDTAERTLKLKSELTETEYLKIEDLTGERKTSGIRNSIRRSLFRRRNLNGHDFKHN